MLMGGPQPQASPFVDDVLRTLRHPPHAHPVLALLPFVGSGYELYADAMDGDLKGATFDAALLGVDLGGAFFVRDGLAAAKLLNTLKGSSAGKVASRKYAAVAKRMIEREMKGEGEHAHHALIPRNQWGKSVPDVLKTHPLNLKVLPEVTHRRLRSAVGDLPQFNLLERYVHGTPTWWKFANGSSAGHGHLAAERQRDRLEDNAKR